MIGARGFELEPSCRRQRGAFVWEMITTRGRLLRGFQVNFVDGEIRISWVKLEPGEDIALLVDRERNSVRLYAPLDDCRTLAARHNYELIVPQKQEGNFVSHEERFLPNAADGAKEEYREPPREPNFAKLIASLLAKAIAVAKTPD